MTGRFARSVPAIYLSVSAVVVVSECSWVCPSSPCSWSCPLCVEVGAGSSFLQPFSIVNPTNKNAATNSTIIKRFPLLPIITFPFKESIFTHRTTAASPVTDKGQQAMRKTQYQGDDRRRQVHLKKFLLESLSALLIRKLAGTQQKTSWYFSLRRSCRLRQYCRLCRTGRASVPGRARIEAR